LGAISQVGRQDRDRVAGGEDYEVRFFADKYGLTTDQVRGLIAKHGHDRETLQREAAKLGPRRAS
jgi:hypothetical protein